MRGPTFPSPQLSQILGSLIDGLWAVSHITIQASFSLSFSTPCPSRGDNLHLRQNVEISVAGAVINHL